MARRAHYKDLSTLWRVEVEKQLFATVNELDFIASIDTIRYTNLLTCDSMNYEFDLGRDLWLNKSRFTVLQREYLDLYQLDTFLKRCKAIGLGEAKRGVITQMPAKAVTIRDKKHRWGGCQIGWTFRGGDRYGPPTLALHSRVAYIAYMGAADLALAWVIAREIGRKIGAAPEEFKFEWHLDASQFHGFKSLPALYSLGFEPILEDEGQYPTKKHPTLKMCRKWYWDSRRKWEAGVPLDAEKYGPLRRIRRRYEEFKRGELMPSVPVADLTLDPLRARG